MNATLTREQVTWLVGDLVNGDIDRAKGEAQLLAHDAAMRQRVEAMEGALAIIKDYLYLEINAGHMPGRLTWLMEHAQLHTRGGGT